MIPKQAKINAFSKTNIMALVNAFDWIENLFQFWICNWPLCAQNMDAIPFISRWAIQTVDIKRSIFRSEFYIP